MNAGFACSLLGGVLELLGIGITIVGAVQTWNKYSPDEHLLESALAWVRRQGAAITRRLRSALGIHEPVHLAFDDSAVCFDGTARLTVGYGTLQLETIATKDALEQLDCRTRELMDDLNKLRDRLIDSHLELDQRLGALETDLQWQIARLEKEDRHLAVGGIRKIVLGLFLVAVGVVFQTVAAVGGTLALAS